MGGGGMTSKGIYKKFAHLLKRALFWGEGGGNSKLSRHPVIILPGPMKWDFPKLAPTLGTNQLGKNYRVVVISTTHTAQGHGTVTQRSSSDKPAWMYACTCTCTKGSQWWSCPQLNIAPKTQTVSDTEKRVLRPCWNRRSLELVRIQRKL